MPANPSESRIESRATLMISVCAAVALLMWFMPRETKFGYEYEQGRPWRYNSLIATLTSPSTSRQRKCAPKKTAR